jgi:hypothetical protein
VNLLLLFFKKVLSINFAIMRNENSDKESSIFVMKLYTKDDLSLMFRFKRFIFSIIVNRKYLIGLVILNFLDDA